MDSLTELKPVNLNDWHYYQYYAPYANHGVYQRLFGPVYAPKELLYYGSFQQQQPPPLPAVKVNKQLAELLVDSGFNDSTSDLNDEWTEELYQAHRTAVIKKVSEWLPSVNPEYRPDEEPPVARSDEHYDDRASTEIPGEAAMSGPPQPAHQRFLPTVVRREAVAQPTYNPPLAQSSTVCCLSLHTLTRTEGLYGAPYPSYQNPGSWNFCTACNDQVEPVVDGYCLRCRSAPASCQCYECTRIRNWSEAPPTQSKTSQDFRGSFECAKCGRKYSNAYFFERHVCFIKRDRGAQSGSFRCDFCGQQTRTARGMNIHKSVKHGQKQGVPLNLSASGGNGWVSQEKFVGKEQPRRHGIKFRPYL